MGSYDGAEICELVGIYRQSQLADNINKTDYEIYRDGELDNLTKRKRQENISNQKTWFKDVSLRWKSKQILKLLNFWLLLLIVKSYLQAI